MQPVFEDPRLEADPRQGRRRRAPVLSGRHDAFTALPICWGSAGWRTRSASASTATRPIFNVNRHINPTDVCVASCKLCAFGKQKRDPKAYTMSLEEVWHKAGEGYSEAVTEFHIVGGLHPELTLDWYCQMLRGLKQRFPQVHLKAFTMVEIGYFAQRGKIERARSAGAPARRRHGFDARRRRRNLSRSRAAHHLRSQAHRPAVDRHRPHRAPDGPAFQLHHALRPHRDRRGPPGSPAAAARAAG